MILFIVHRVHRRESQTVNRVGDAMVDQAPDLQKTWLTAKCHPQRVKAGVEEYNHITQWLD